MTSGSIVRAGEILTVSYTGTDELILNGFEQMGDTDQYKVVARRDAPPSISFETATTPDPVDKTALETAIALAETKEESDYTPNSWSALQDALSAAQAVANDDDATTDDVTDAAATLAEAINALILRADKTALTGAIEAATAYTESEYTPESWQALTEALTAAQSVLEDDNAAPGEVTDAANAIQSAIAGLAAVAPPEEPVDKTALNEAIAAAAELAPTDYT
ncbi:MAG: FIVAR domain-containing protein, partial [Gracilibacteraceae bacterium]|nr:FIVAR domain-containing protein [Gracilibacteraceae bacterium]